MYVLFFIGMGLLFASAAALFGLWISALVSVIQNPVVKKENKIPWFLLIFFVNPIGPIIFFFMHNFKKRAWWMLGLVVASIFLFFAVFAGAIGTVGTTITDYIPMSIDTTITD